jgi:hypothetical protein
MGRSSSSINFDKDGVSNTYFPIVAKSSFNIDIVVTELYNSYSDTYIDGYIINNESNSLHSVRLGIQTTEQAWWCNPLIDPPYPCTEIEYRSPALDATLPNQPNPFRYSCYGKGTSCVDINNIFLVSARRIEPSGENYYPLTDVNWDYIPIDENSGRLSGIIRNDSKKTLHNMQLVVFGPCAYRYAQIASSTLKPGRRTSFELAGSEYCLGNEILISGQGTITP